MPGVIRCNQQHKYVIGHRMAVRCAKRLRRRTKHPDKRFKLPAIQALHKHGRSSPTFTAKKSTCLFEANDGADHALRCVPSCSSCLSASIDDSIDPSTPWATTLYIHVYGVGEKKNSVKKTGEGLREAALDPHPVPCIVQ